MFDFDFDWLVLGLESGLLGGLARALVPGKTCMNLLGYAGEQ